MVFVPPRLIRSASLHFCRREKLRQRLSVRKKLARIADDDLAIRRNLVNVRAGASRR
jgi:hypothetical protein